MEKKSKDKVGENQTVLSENDLLMTKKDNLRFGQLAVPHFGLS